MRRLRPFALLLLGASGVVTLGYVGLRFVQWGWRLGLTEHKVLVGTLIFWAGVSIGFLAFLLIIETRIGFLRARRDLRDELLDEAAARAVAQRLADTRPAPRVVHCHACGKAMQKPFFFDRRIGGVICGECVRKQEKASAN